SCSMLLGTSHHGLRITPVAKADSCGVGVDSLPAIARCFHRLTPSSTKVAWNPGTLTITYLLPRSRGSHRQRSMLSRIRSRAAASLAGVAASAALSAAYCGWLGSRLLSAAVRSCAASELRSKASCLAALRSLSTTYQSIRAGLFTWPSARSEDSA